MTPSTGARCEIVILVCAIARAPSSAQHQAPTAVALFEKIVKAPGANDIADDAVDRSALRDRHLSLRDRARAELGAAPGPNGRRAFRKNRKSARCKRHRR